MGLARLCCAALLMPPLASCSSRLLAPATSRLAPRTTQLRDQQPEDATAAVYRGGQALLIFVGAVHENQTNSATFKMIRDAYAGFHIDVVITEGYPTTKGPNPPRLMKYAEEEVRSGFQEGGESVPTIAGAIKEGAQVWGGEPDDTDITSRVMAEGFSPADLLGYYALRVVPQWIREGKINDAGDPRLRALVDLELRRGRSALKLETAVLPNFNSWASWYQSLNGKPIGADFTTEEVGPLQDGSFGSNMIAAAVSRARDAFLHELIIKHLQEGKAVLVVFGGSHLAIQRPAFDAVLGRPCYAGANLDEAPVRCGGRN